MANKPVAIFRTKQQIDEAVTLKNIKVSTAVLQNPAYKNAEPHELLGFYLEDGSDYTIVDVKKIKDDPKAFMEIAFGVVK